MDSRKQDVEIINLGFCTVRPLYPLYMRWGVTKLQVADLAGAQSLSAIEQPSTSADSSIIEDTRVHDSLENNANILETKEAEKEIDAEAELLLEEGSSSDSAKSSNVQFSNTVASDTKEYLEIFKELSESSDPASIFNASYLEEKLRKKFVNK
ncbi:hypothetical protein J6590_016052 [Homalodisca vitripennis]|nr:hypothetical protein J6590_016052 [Homalodisca vitripennis]